MLFNLPPGGFPPTLPAIDDPPDVLSGWVHLGQGGGSTHDQPCSFSAIYPGLPRRKSRRKFVISGPIDHNDQPHPFGKNYIRMMRKTLRIFCRLRFLIKSFIEKLSSKKYFFSSKFRCSSVRWVFCTQSSLEYA